MILPPQRGQERPRVVRLSTSIANEISSGIFPVFDQSLLPPRRLRIMNIEQKIVTGGTNKTSTPMLRFLIKLALFEPASEARHMAHWAEAEPAPSKISRTEAASAIQNVYFSTGNSTPQVPKVRESASPLVQVL